MSSQPVCKTFADICRMLDNSIRKGGKVKVSSRPMPSDEVLAREKAEIKAFIRKREKDDERKAKREELKNKGNINK